MIVTENQCVGCPTELGCLGDSCPNRGIRCLVCDECDCAADILYVVDGQEVCEDCLKNMFDTIEL